MILASYILYMGVGHDFDNGCEWCAYGCGCGVWCGTCGHVDMWPRLAVVPCVPLWCWVLVLGGVVVGVGVGVLVNWSPMAVASRLMGFNGVGCGCGHCPMLGGVVVVLECVAMWDEHRQSPLVWGRPLMAWDRGRGCGAGGIGWCKHSISKKKKNKKSKKKKRKTKKSILRRFKGIKILWWYSCSFSG